MKVAERNSARSSWPRHMYRRLQRRHRQAHVGRVCRDAMLAGTQNRERTIVTSDRWTSTAGLTFVAGHRRVAKVHAACALQKVAANRRHIAYLGRGAVQNRLRQDGIVFLHL